MTKLAGAGMFGMGVFAFSGTGMFLFGCAHYGVWWPVFALLAFVIAFLSGGLCYNYNQNEDLTLLNLDMRTSEQNFRNCRDAGWIFVGLMCMLSIGISPIVWYNEPNDFQWPGVLWTMSGVTQLWWAYILWLRIFIFHHL